MTLRSRIRAVDLPTVRDQTRALARTYLGRGDDPPEQPETLQEFVRLTNRSDFALWWVSRRMSILAAHEAQTIPHWDACAVRPALAGIIGWEGGTGLSIPVWAHGHLRPDLAEAIGLTWWTIDGGEHVSISPLVRADLAGWGSAAARMLLTPIDHSSPLCDRIAVREAERRVADLWATSVTLALEPRIGVLHRQRPEGPGASGLGRPKHRSKITVVELRAKEPRQIHRDNDPERERAWTLDHQVPVRGHWRQQACGPGHKWRKPVYVLPHFRGPIGETPAEERPIVHVWRR